MIVDKLLAHIAAMRPEDTVAKEFCRYLPVRVGTVECAGLVDSGNLWRNAISPSLLSALGLSDDDLAPLTTKRLNTAKKGAQLVVKGELKRPIQLELPGVSRKFATRPIVIEGLSMELNISGPFLKLHKIDQIHTRNCLRVDGVDVPLRAAAKGPPPDRSVNMVVQRDRKIPPGHHAYVQLKSATKIDASVQEGVLDGDLQLEERSDLHLWRGAIVSVGSDGECVGGVMNTTANPVVLRKGTVYGELQLCKRQQDDEHQLAFISGEEEADTVTLAAVHPTAAADASADASSRGGTAAASQARPAAAETADRKTWTVTQKRKWLEEEFKLAESPWLTSAALVSGAVDLLLQYWDVFSHAGEFGKTSLIQHEIHTQPGPPIKCKYRPINPVLEKDLERQLKEWKAHDVIEESQSQWSFALVAASKKNSDKKRWCVDYRPLNNVTLKDTFPLPNIEDNLVRLGKSKVFSGIDGCGAYHVVEVAPKDRPKTAFATPQGLFQFKRMPFGLTNAPATYCRLVQMVLAGIPHDVALPYLDDTCVHSPDLQGHFKGLAQVLEAHRKAGLKLQPSKCQLFQEEIEYLGHIISAQGVRPPAKYVQVVKDWPLPRTRTEARAFLGKVGYYRRFIQGYSALAAPWTDVTGKGDAAEEKTPLVHDKAMRSSFEALKAHLLKAPILAYPRFDLDAPFILDTDWSGDFASIGAVLSQEQDGEERVIAYGAKKLSQSQGNYPPCKGELWALVYFAKHWRYFLLHRKFLWRTDHEGLKYLRTMEPPKGMVGRWLELLGNYEFDIQYRPGPQHGNADALSRIAHADPAGPCEVDETICAVGLGQPEQVVPFLCVLGLGRDELWTRDELIDLQEADDDMGPIKKAVEAGQPLNRFEIRAMSALGKIYAGMASTLKISQAGLLCRVTTDDVGGEEVLQVCMPKEAVATVMDHAHCLGGHKAVGATVARLRRNVYFPHMKQEVTDWIEACRDCAQKTHAHPTQRHTLVSIQDGYPFHRIAIDFVGPLRPSHRGNVYLLTVKDTFSRWLEAIPVKRANASTVVDVLEREIFARYGIPETIHSDRGSHFVNSLLREVADVFSIRLTMTPAYNPKSNPVERSHRDLGEILRALLETGDQESWEKVLPQALFAMRTAVCTATGMAPYRALFGRDAAQPLDLIFGQPPTVAKGNLPHHEYAQQLRQRIDVAQEYARKHMADTVRRRKRQYHADKKEFVVGAKVWLFTQRSPLGESRKLARYWTGPWTIVEQINDVLYKIDPDPTWNYHRGPEVVGIDRLKAYHPERPIQQPPEQNDDLGMPDDEFAVDINLQGGGGGGGGGAGLPPPPPGGGGGPGPGPGPGPGAPQGPQPTPPQTPPGGPSPPGSGGGSTAGSGSGNGTSSRSSHNDDPDDDPDYRPPAGNARPGPGTPPQRRDRQDQQRARPQEQPQEGGGRGELINFPHLDGRTRTPAGDDEGAAGGATRAPVRDDEGAVGGATMEQGHDLMPRRAEGEARNQDELERAAEQARQEAGDEHERRNLRMEADEQEELTLRARRMEEDAEDQERRSLRAKRMEDANKAEEARNTSKGGSLVEQPKESEEEVRRREDKRAAFARRREEQKREMEEDKKKQREMEEDKKRRATAMATRGRKLSGGAGARPKTRSASASATADRSVGQGEDKLATQRRRREEAEDARKRQSAAPAPPGHYPSPSQQQEQQQHQRSQKLLRTPTERETGSSRRPTSPAFDHSLSGPDTPEPPRPIMKRAPMVVRKLDDERARAHKLRERQDEAERQRQLEKQMTRELQDERRLTQHGPPGVTPARYKEQPFDRLVAREARQVADGAAGAAAPKVADPGRGKVISSRRRTGESDSGAEADGEE